MKTKKVQATGLGVAIFVALIFVWRKWLMSLGAYNFTYMEEGRTFFFTESFAYDTYCIVGGLGQFLADLCQYWFVTPSTGITLTAIISAISITFMGLAFRFITGTRYAFPLAAFPIIAQTVLLYNTNYHYTSLIAFFMFSLGLYDFSRYRTTGLDRIAYALYSTMSLFWMCGPIATLYALSLFIIMLIERPTRAMPFLAPIVVLFVAAWLLTQTSDYGKIQHLIFPHGYFTLRLKAGSLVYLPWVQTLVMLVFLGLIRYMRIAWRNKGLAPLGIVVGIGAIIFGAYAGRKYVDPANETFKELSYLSRHGQWDKVLELTDKSSNILFQNYRNMALAEQGRLADEVFLSPCYDIQSIYLQGDKTPYVAALLSDIYFSMGHIALAQRYAFEANEGLGNQSPRMLQRLSQTALIYGRYELAAKYLKMLHNNSQYEDWADRHMPFLHNDAALEADSLLGLKRRCLFADNRLSGSLGLDDDLKQIVRTCPDHEATIQYLGSLCLLLKDLDKFNSVIREFYHGRALPRAFSEGALALQMSGRKVEPQWITDDVRSRYTRFEAHPGRERYNFWYFYKHTR